MKYLLLILVCFLAGCSHLTLVKDCTEYVSNENFSNKRPVKRYLCKTLSSWEYK